jgi:hypothetical protein
MAQRVEQLDRPRRAAVLLAGDDLAVDVTAEQGLDVDQARRVLSLVGVLPHTAEAVGGVLARMCGLSWRSSL